MFIERLLDGLLRNISHDLFLVLSVLESTQSGDAWHAVTNGLSVNVASVIRISSGAFQELLSKVIIAANAAELYSRSVRAATPSEGAIKLRDSPRQGTGAAGYPTHT